LIPSYQPTETLCNLLQEIRRHDASPIVVVDDGSGAGYQPIFQRAIQVPGTTLLANAVNLGKGAALKHGMNYVLVNHPECTGVVTADADGQHSATDVLKVALEFSNNPDGPLFGTRAKQVREPGVAVHVSDLYRGKSLGHPNRLERHPQIVDGALSGDPCQPVRI
jgi:dolichol-phosphate mannosyltransferase